MEGRAFPSSEVPGHRQIKVGAGRRLIILKNLLQDKSMESRLEARFWEVDLLRGAAVIMMISFHFAFDLSYLGLRPLDVYSGAWFFLARGTAGLYLLLVGISLVLSASRAEQQNREVFPHLLRRGLWIFSLGMGLTLATYILIGEGFIVFGVLHLTGISIILSYPFLKWQRLSGLLGLSIIFAGGQLQGMELDYPWLFWLGLTPAGFNSLDYFPLIPWWGVVLVGISLGSFFYRGYCRRVQLPDLSFSPPIKPILALGRNSLLIYLVHQPILIALLLLFGRLDVQAI
jgi:uncharacterized membrane protein